MNPLRLALYEINVEGAEPHGPVNAAVALAPKRKAGLVNAVLRNVLRRGTSWDELPVPTMPKWLRKPLVKAWGKDAVAAMEQVHAGPVPLDLTLRDPNADMAAVLGDIIGDGKGIAQYKEQLRENDDPTAPLLDVLHLIDRRLSALRRAIKVQSKGRRGKSKRHDTPELPGTEVTRKRQKDGFKGESDQEEDLPSEERKRRLSQDLEALQSSLCVPGRRRGMQLHFRLDYV